MIDLKITKLLTPLLIYSFLVLPSYATEIKLTRSWAQLYDGSAGLTYSNDYSDIIKVLQAEISHSQSGKQRLYFTDSIYEGSSSCKYESIVSSTTTMIFNGQAVKMSSWCKKYSDTSNYYYSLTPTTEQGHNYIVNLFKIATSPIKIQYNNETLYFPVTGFTKAWNSAGGNAI